MNKFKRGFSLLEIMIVVSILVIISSIAVGFYLNYGKNVEINSVAQTMVFDLKQAQSRSMIGEGGFKWGIHFVNQAVGADYYEIFSTATDYANGAVVSRNYLSNSIAFSTPSSGNFIDIIFNKISGGITTASSIVITSANITKNISVSDIGIITVQ